MAIPSRAEPVAAQRYVPLADATRRTPQRIGGNSRPLSCVPVRSVALIIGLGLLVTGCADGAVTAATPRQAAPTPGDASPSPAEPASPVIPAPSTSAAADGWTGPVRGASASPTADGAAERGDAARGYVDIVRASSDSGSQPHWRLRLSAAPPKAATLDPARTVISYGLAFETTGDDEPEYLVGISNEAPGEGDYRVWVTDLVAGTTDEKVGPPYGFPIEFAHPDELSDEQAGNAAMVFTFLGDSRPPGVSGQTRFYAWASVTEDGEVAAWDYAPDTGWIGGKVEALAPEEPAAEPMPIGGPNAPPGFPECQAQEFDFIGEGTLREFGLDTATTVPPPDVDRQAKIWVTRDLMPHDFGPEGGPVEMTRMLCFEFVGGSGGSGWPVDPAWRPPADGGVTIADATVSGLSSALLPAALLAALLITLSVLAFRTRR
jgi:hypothetical protein